MDVLVRPLDDDATTTLSCLGVALDALLTSTIADALDSGQHEMLVEAGQRIAQVLDELATEGDS